MKRRIPARVAIVTAAALVAAGTATVGISAATSEHRTTANRPTTSGKPTEKEIAALFDQWNADVQSGDPEKVAARYARDAVLLPTLSPEIRTDHAGIVDYFEHFLQNKPRGEKIRTVINVLDGNSAIDTGVYAFRVTDVKTGVERTVEARYTFEYEKRGGEWLIVNHHSSVLPPAI
ncbi:SgcJ/EcaC family oxidoreductase [Streptomyces sp. KR80]|uniref:SgcJ/EcaC family oxidoreductase n=1 Tax=Streptomyces sp. KR80 TaxID=3457426 RepID=UPI003FD59896